MALDQDSLFRIAAFGMLLHVVSSSWLRSSIGSDTSLVDQLFQRPTLADSKAKQLWLRGRFFVPWIPAPAGLREHSVLTRLTFWAARLGGILIVVGILGFVFRVFWDVTRQ